MSSKKYLFILVSLVFIVAASTMSFFIFRDKKDPEIEKVSSQNLNNSLETEKVGFKGIVTLGRGGWKTYTNYKHGVRFEIRDENNIYFPKEEQRSHVVFGSTEDETLNLYMYETFFGEDSLYTKDCFHYASFEDYLQKYYFPYFPDPSSVLDYVKKTYNNVGQTMYEVAYHFMDKDNRTISIKDYYFESKGDNACRQYIILNFHQVNEGYQKLRDQVINSFQLLDTP